MTITISNVGKRYDVDWVFRKVHLRLEQGRSYALLGPNGSGKTTMLHLISGWITPTEGHVQFQYDGRALPAERWYEVVSFTAPYVELIDEFCVSEMVHYHCRMHPRGRGLSVQTLLAIAELEKQKGMLLRSLSSGMKQRLKIALGVLLPTPVLLLDEPTANLDAAGIAWYRQLMEQYSADRLVVVASNQSQDYSFCTDLIHVTDFK